MNIIKQLKTKAARFNNFTGFKVIPNPFMMDRVPVRKHKKTRIHRKWLKRYGWKHVPSRKVGIEVRDRLLVAHPIMLNKIKVFLDSFPKPIKDLKELALQKFGKAIADSEWLYVQANFPRDVHHAQLICSHCMEKYKRDRHRFDLHESMTEEIPIYTVVLEMHRHRNQKHYWLGCCANCKKIYWKEES